MDIDTLRLNALVHLAGKIPEDALPHLGSLAHLSLWLSPRSRRRLHSGLGALFGFGTTNRKRGLRRMLGITELDHDMRADAAREAVRLRRAVPLLGREAVRKFFAALQGDSVLRGHYQFLLDPAEDEEALETIFSGVAFRAGGLVSGLTQGMATAPSTPAPPRLIVDPDNYRAVLDGDPYPLTSWEQGTLLKTLNEANGNWVSSTDIVRACPDLAGTRLDRQVSKLPGPIRSLIESKQGTGYRLRTS